MRIRNIVVMLLLIVWAFPLLARGGGHRSSGSHSSYRSHSSRSYTPRTHTSRTYVHSYTQRNGTHVGAHTRSYRHSTGFRTHSPRQRTYAPRLRSARSSSTYRAYHPRALTRSSTFSSGVQRDSHGRFKRSSSAKHQFMTQTGYSRGRPGYVIDHIKPLCRGGADSPSNMQWQTVAAAKAKDRTECGHH